MARTIGRKNVNLVKKITREEVAKHDLPYKLRSDSEPNIEDSVIEKLPATLWDIWESADAEIRRIIWDTMFDVKKKREDVKMNYIKSLFNGERKYALLMLYVLANFAAIAAGLIWEFPAL